MGMRKRETTLTYPLSLMIGRDTRRLLLSQERTVRADGVSCGPVLIPAGKTSGLARDVARCISQTGRRKQHLNLSMRHFRAFEFVLPGICMRRRSCSAGKSCGRITRLALSSTPDCDHVWHALSARRRSARTTKKANEYKGLIRNINDINYLSFFKFAYVEPPFYMRAHIFPDI